MIRADLQQNIQTREQKISEVKSSVKACKVSRSRLFTCSPFIKVFFNILIIRYSFQGGLDAEWLEINSVFSEVMKVVEDSRKKALQPLEERWVAQ